MEFAKPVLLMVACQVKGTKAGQGLALGVTAVTTRSGWFTSVMMHQVMPGEKPSAVACTYTCWLPSGVPSFTVVAGTSTKDEPMGMLTVAGTVSSVTSDEISATSRAAVVGVLRCTRIVPALARPSASVAGLTDTVSVGPSLSATVRSALTFAAVDTGALHPQPAS